MTTKPRRSTKASTLVVTSPGDSAVSATLTDAITRMGDLSLADLERLEAEVQNKGWRVRFRNGTDDWCYLPGLSENGAADRLDAVEWAGRLDAIAKYKSLRDIAVVGPDLEPDAIDTPPASAAAEAPHASAAAPTRSFGRFGQPASSNPNRLAGGVDLTGLGAQPESEEDEAPPADARPVVDGIPTQGTVLAFTDDTVLIGDENATVYACPRAAIEGKPGYSWKPKVKRMENVILGPGTDGRGGGASIPWLNWAGHGMLVRAAFHAPSGQWFVRRDA